MIRRDTKVRLRLIRPVRNVRLTDEVELRRPQELYFKEKAVLS